MKNKLVQIESNKVFQYLSEGAEVYRMNVDNDKFYNLRYQDVDDIYNVIQDQGDFSNYVYFLILKEAQ